MPGSSLAPRTCRQCGKTFIGGPRAWYCPDCRLERKREELRRYRQRKAAGKSIKLGETIGHCEVCGKEFIYTAANQKYCPECAPKAIAEIDRQQGRGWLKRAVKKHGQQYAEERNAEKRVNRKYCVDCGAPLAPGHGGNKSYCPVCEQLHKRYQGYKVYVQQTNPSQLLSYEKWKERGGKRYCSDCGALLEPGSGSNRKYCAKCKKLRVRYASYKVYSRRLDPSHPIASFEEWKNGKR